MSIFRGLAPILAALTSLIALPAAAAWPAEHLAEADGYVATIAPKHNDYGAPSLVSVENGVLHVFAECGGFVAELLKNTYEGVITDAVLSALADDDPTDAKTWSAPDSRHWFDAIVAERSATVGGKTYAFVFRETVDELAVGDILVARYTDSGSTGHTMIVRQRQATPTLVASTIPGHDVVERYTLQVVDSTQSVHLDAAGTTDTRYKKDISPITKAAVNDRGVGKGDIYVYADPDTGELVGWTWSTKQQVAYQGVDPTPAPGVGKYRPLAAGRIVGPGL